MNKSFFRFSIFFQFFQKFDVPNIATNPIEQDTAGMWTNHKNQDHHGMLDLAVTLECNNCL